LGRDTYAELRDASQLRLADIAAMLQSPSGTLIRLWQRALDSAQRSFDRATTYYVKSRLQVGDGRGRKEIGHLLF
jgi:hypothetical protein